MLCSYIVFTHGRDLYVDCDQLLHASVRRRWKCVQREVALCRGLTLRHVHEYVRMSHAKLINSRQYAKGGVLETS